MLILFIVGTRPEAIKLAPVIAECRTRANIEVIVCSTGQHREMLHQALGSFGITPDIDLELMTTNQNLSSLTARALTTLGQVFEQHHPDLVIVQGDTTTAMAGALAAFYAQIPVAHIEAGLRTWNRFNPFPEEINRTIIDQIATYYMAPTTESQENLIRSGVDPKHIWITGNTAVDAILAASTRAAENPVPSSLPNNLVDDLENGSKLIVVTGHRRESFGTDFESICQALLRISENHPDLHIVYPVHLNPNVREPVYRILNNSKRIHLIEPLPYIDFVWLLANSYIVLSDSGGIQEEVPSLNKPILVMRTTTERPEGVAAGCARLVGVSVTDIVMNVDELVNDSAAYELMSNAETPYGDGSASKRIADIIGRIPSSNE